VAVFSSINPPRGWGAGRLIGEPAGAGVVN